MKPSFALNFTDTAVGLLHRTSHGWLEVGAVGFDEPDLATALTYLRGSALGLEPRGITTKLVIPNSQIKYMSLPAPGPDAASRRAQIRDALEGKTPYSVDELVFDWSGTGKTVQVAVVARETLEEAERFARENRFNPVSLVAIPEPGSFGGEPWFGPTALAPSILADAEKVERDQDPIKIVGRAQKADAEKPGPDTEITPTTPAPEAERVAQSTLAPDGASVDKPQSTSSDEAVPHQVAPAQPVAVHEQPPDLATADMQAAQPAEAVPPAVNPGAAGSDKNASVVETVKARVTDSVIADQVDPLDEDLADLPPIPPARIAAAVRVAEASKGQGRSLEPSKKAASAAGRPNGAKPAPAVTPRISAISGGAAVPSSKIAPITAEWPLERVATAARAGKGETTRGGAMITSTSIPLPRDRKLTVVPPVESAVAPEATAGKSRSEAETMTVFGARKSRQPGKPRYLFVILVVLLMAIMAAVYIWSAIVQASRDAGQDAIASATEATGPTPGSSEPDAPAATLPIELEPTNPVPEVATAAVPAQPSEPEQPAAEVAVFTEGETSTAPEPAAAPAAVEPEPEATPLPEPAPLDGAALATATGTSEANRTPGNDPQDEIFLALVENRVSTSDAVSLQPPVASTDAVPGAQPLPPPFGTLYKFDAEGRIMPTAEGIVTPEGVRLVAGKPPRVPPARPEPPAYVTESSVQPAELADPAASIPEPFFADPALASARPRFRPADLVPAPEPAATDDGASVDVADATRLTSLKPRARPPELLARGEAQLAERTAEASAEAQAASASLVAGLADSPGSPLAVAVSRKPAARPQTLDRSIEAAVQLAAADASLVPETVLLAPAAPAPVEPPPPAAKPQVEPIAKAPTLRLPKEEPNPTDFSKEEANDPAVVELDEPDGGSQGSSKAAKSIVAKKATYANALNLSKISLIGVFGSPSNRYAMVRQPGGRFVKVEVGDRIDGGKIAAISDRGVSYVKNGQTHTLSMPRG